MLKRFKERKKSFPKNVIRKKLLLYFFISAVFVNSICLFTYGSTQITIGKLNSIFKIDTQLTNLSGNLETVETSLKNYLITNHSEDLQTYILSSNELQNSADSLKVYLTQNNNELLLVDIKSMISTYLIDTNATVNEKRGRDINGYSDGFNSASQIYSDINTYIDKLKIYEFQENNQSYLNLDAKLSALQFFNMIVILASILLNIVLIYIFAYSVTKPIITLSKTAASVAEGNYDIPEVEVNSHDEVGVLAVTFNRMTENIRRQIGEIKEKSLIEQQLKEQEVQNLKMKSTLGEAQLRSLQSQIDPHYIFNTLNAGMQIAMFEGAERTQAYMENLANTLRYSLGNIDKPATFTQEAENVDNYIYLLRERFGDQICYQKDIEEGLPSFDMPRMILQPIVENAFLHGIAGLEGGGVITLSARLYVDVVRVEICDNGFGMSEENIAAVLSDDDPGSEESTASKGKEHFGIGLKNVIGRLKYFYHIPNASQLVEITSVLQKGTTIALKLQCKKWEDI